MKSNQPITRAMAKTVPSFWAVDVAKIVAGTAAGVIGRVSSGGDHRWVSG